MFKTFVPTDGKPLPIPTSLIPRVFHSGKIHNFSIHNITYVPNPIGLNFIVSAPNLKVK